MLASGCAGAGSYVWITDLPVPQDSENEYVIQDGDLVDIKVFNQEPMSTHARVRTDGRLALPVLGDIVVRGKTPSAIKAELESRLKDYVNPASVTVIVDEPRAISVSVLGEVAHQGVFPVDRHATLAQVLALAGGLTDYASRDRLFVIRSFPQPIRIRFTYESLSRGEPHTAAFSLHQGDLVVAE